MVLLSLFLLFAWVGLPQANPSLSAKVFARAKGTVFVERDWRATLAHPLLLAARALANSKVPRTLLEFFCLHKRLSE